MPVMVAASSNYLPSKANELLEMSSMMLRLGIRLLIGHITLTAHMYTLIHTLPIFRAKANKL
jgi:hypothetical protein